MMKRFLVVMLLALMCTLACNGQSYTTVTGTVTDPAGTPYAGGRVQIAWVPGANCSSATWANTNIALPFLTAATTLSTTGALTAMNLPDNHQTNCPNSQWSYQVCSTGNICFTTSITITGASQNIGATLQAAAVMITVTPTIVPPTKTVATLPATAVKGTLYTVIDGNSAVDCTTGTGTTTVTCRWSGSVWAAVQGSGGSGTVTNTGNLTANSIMVGNGGADSKVMAADPTNCTAGNAPTGIDKTGAVKGCAAIGGGGGTPGGANTQIQFNDSGAFGGSAFFTVDKTLGTFTINGCTWSVSGGVLASSCDIALAQLLPNVAGGAPVGSSTLPWSGIYIGGAATNNILVTGTATAARQVNLPDATTYLPIATQFITWTGPTAPRSYTLPDANATLVYNGVRRFSCQPGIGDGLNAVTAATYLESICYNDTGSTVTLTNIRCFTDNNGTSTLAATNGAGTALLTGAVTCTTAFAAGTQSGTTTIAAGDFIKLTWVLDGTSKQLTSVVTGTY